MCFIKEVPTNLFSRKLSSEPPKPVSCCLRAEHAQGAQVSSFGICDQNPLPSPTPVSPFKAWLHLLLVYSLVLFLFLILLVWVWFCFLKRGVQERNSARPAFTAPNPEEKRKRAAEQVAPPRGGERRLQGCRHSCSSWRGAGRRGRRPPAPVSSDPGAAGEPLPQPKPRPGRAGVLPPLRLLLLSGGARI